MFVHPSPTPFTLLPVSLFGAHSRLFFLFLFPFSRLVFLLNSILSLMGLFCVFSSLMWVPGCVSVPTLTVDTDVWFDDLLLSRFLS